MPSRHTFTIKPIRELLARYVGDGKGWADPFAGENSPAEHTNDLNPAKPATHHLHAEQFAEWCPSELNGVLWDPPYSPRQIREVYDGFGIQGPARDFQSLAYVKRLLAPKIRMGGLAICCGWHSQGFGKGLGFAHVEILMVPHGKDHNDTIVTVERRTAHQEVLDLASHRLTRNRNDDRT
ncbi:MAG: adenine-specific DNA methylase [Gemmatimonadota bacterium]|nr:adenine-specific DNA methylase [Gemmatimonadota bacterium]